MKLPGGFDHSEEAEEKAAFFRSMTPMDWVVTGSGVIFALLMVPFTLLGFFAFLMGSFTPDPTTGRIFPIVMGRHSMSTLYVEPWLGHIYDGLLIAAASAAGLFIVLLSLGWILKRIGFISTK